MREREKNMTVLREKKEALQDRIQHLKKSNGKSPKLQDLEQELQVATNETRDKEMELGDFKRFILREAFYLRFNALHEYGEKSAILAGHGKYLVDLLDIEPTPKGQTNRRPFTHDSSMILMDALLTVDGWKDADERPTTLEGEYDQDADELTEEQIKPASCSSSECSVDMEKKGLPFMEKSDYHQLYKSLSHIQQQPMHRTYSEFQQQFDSKEKEALKSELPPAYEDDGYHYAKDVKKKE
jgi:hypothetical protein